MKLFEYQGKQLFKAYDISIPKGKIVEKKSDLSDFVFSCILKAQVLIGGRGKAAGIQTAENIKAANEKCHVELTTLIVTGINDDMKEMKDIIDFISIVDRNIPWHISRYHPSYKYNAHATDIDFIMAVYKEACKELNFVYCGNIPGSYGGSDTICPSCGALVISRNGYSIRTENLENGKCKKCSSDIHVIS